MDHSPDKPAAPTMYCMKCHYVLDGITSTRCPECGKTFYPGDPQSFDTMAVPVTLSTKIVCCGFVGTLILIMLSPFLIALVQLLRR